MEVTRSNFSSVLAEMLEAISSATFVSIDGEFTGLSAGGTAITFLDSPKMRYYKLKHNQAIDFLLLQMGICTFHQDVATNSFVARPYNVFLFPRSPCGLRFVSSPNPVFKCQTSSIEFLAAQDFDFNKAIKEGVGYFPLIAHQKLKDDLLLKEKEQLLLEVMQRDSLPSPGTPNAQRLQSPKSQQPQSQQKQQNQTFCQVDPIPEEQKPYLDGVVKKIEEFLADPTQTSLDLPPSNAFQRKLVFQTVQNKYAAVLQGESIINSKHERYVSLTKADEEGKKKIAEEKSKEKWRQVEEVLGFTRVIKALADSEKIIVGHNMLLDVLHLLNNFVYPGLPDDYDEFKLLAHETFPNIIDTKVLATNLPFKELISDHALGPLRDRLEHAPFQPPNISLAPGFEKYQYKRKRAFPKAKCEGTNGSNSTCDSAADDGPLHEAGYDAFITGICFTTMATYLSSFLDPPVVSISPSSQLVKSYLNKIHMMRSSADLPYLTLDGPDLDPTRDHVFHLTFPRDWKNTEIFQLFKKYGQIYIGWIDETHAFVTLKDKDFAATVAKFLCASPSSSLSPSATYRLIPFSSYLETFWSQMTPHSRSSKTTPATEREPKTDAPFPGGKRSASQAGLAAAASSSQDASTPKSSVDDDGKDASDVPKRSKRSVTSLAAAALMGRRHKRTPLSRPPPPSSSVSTSSHADGDDGDGGNRGYSWTKSCVSKAKQFLSRALAGASSTEGDAADAAAVVSAANEAGSKRKATAEGEDDEEREEGELADSSTDEETLAKKKKMTARTRIGEEIHLVKEIHQMKDGEELHRNGEDVKIKIEVEKDGEEESSSFARPAPENAGPSKEDDRKNKIVESTSSKKSYRDAPSSLSGADEADLERIVKEEVEEKTDGPGGSTLSVREKCGEEGKGEGTDDDDDDDDDDEDDVDESSSRKGIDEGSGKKKKTGKAAKNSFKRLSTKRKGEKEKAYEAKVKLFEEDEEWN